MQKSKSIFNTKVKAYSKELGAEAPLVIIKNLKNRWGSATKDNVINLNVNLLKTPHDVINYIILHELSSKNKGDGRINEKLRKLYESIVTIQ